jgi:DNA-binding LacI/PurR family transcriptional regulator
MTLTITELREKHGATQSSIALWAGVSPSVVSYYNQNPTLVSPEQKVKIESALSEIEYVASTIIPAIQESLPGFMQDLRNVDASKRFLAAARAYLQAAKAQTFLTNLAEAQKENNVAV